MTEYENKFSSLAAFAPLNVFMPLAKVIADKNLKQFHIAETEKYAHVTYFFNGGNETPYPGENRLLVESLLRSHYEEHPEMRAEKIADEVIFRIKNYDFILVNLANADMVGHTGDFEATQRALEVLDREVGRIVEEILKNDGIVIFKCQDCVSSAKQYFSHCWVMYEAMKYGFYPKDLFILFAKNRINDGRKQQHARKYHSYFWVFKKQKCKVDYSDCEH